MNLLITFTMCRSVGCVFRCGQFNDVKRWNPTNLWYIHWKIHWTIRTMTQPECIAYTGAKWLFNWRRRNDGEKSRRSIQMHDMWSRQMDRSVSMIPRRVRVQYCWLRELTITLRWARIICTNRIYIILHSITIGTHQHWNSMKWAVCM